MNITIYQPKGVYSRFGMNSVPTANNVLAKGTLTPKQEDAKRSKRKKAALVGLAVAGAAALGAFLVYYKKNSKILKWPETDTLIGMNDSDFAKLNKTVYKEDYLNDLIEKREIYQKCLKGPVGKIQNMKTRLSDYFKRHFYNY